MKRITILAAFLLSFAFGTKAQSIAFKGGYSHSDVILSPLPVSLVSPKNAFHFGIVMHDLNLTEKMAIQPELLYSMQGFDVGSIGNVSFHYLSMPVLLNMKMADNVSLLVGPQVSYLADARIGIGSDLFSISYKNAFNPIDVSLVGGMEYKVNNQFSVGGRYVLGMTDVNKDFQISSNHTFNDYVSLKNTNIQLYVTFAFK